MSSSQLLSEQHCEICRPNSVLTTAEEQKSLLNSLNQWKIVEDDGVAQLYKIYTFENFVLAMAFANQIAELAEAENHHPTLLVEWGRVSVKWWTHAIGGLHKNDFIMAAKVDSLL